MLALCALSTSWFSGDSAFCAIESPPCGRVPLALVILPLLTVIDTCTSPYCVFSAGPVKVPDLPAGAVVFGALGVAECVAAGVLAAGVVECDGFGWGFLVAVLCGDGFAEAVPASEPLLDGVGDAVTVGVTGAVLVTAMPATCVLYENSAARPAAVVPRTTTARRMKPPVRNWLPGQKSKDSKW